VARAGGTRAIRHAADAVRPIRIDAMHTPPISQDAPPTFEWDYDPAPERLPVRIPERCDLFIGGKFVAPRSRKRFETMDPAEDRPLSQIAAAGPADVDAAVEAARSALPKWARLAPAERARHLFRLARRIQERSRELAVLESIDGGKPIRESRDVDLPLVAQHFFHHAGWADKLEWVFAGRTPRPVGVCGQIVPWNFPLLMAAWKLAPALACGNTCVLKPAETTSLTAIRLAEIIEELEFPPGVVNVITGDGSTGRLLVEHPGVDKIAFTGSTEVGKSIARAVAGSGKRLTLELGGKSPNVIFADAPLHQAIEGIVSGIWFNQGHVCCAGSRLLVEESVLPDVIELLRDRMSTLRVGHPLDKNTDVGAINSPEQLERITAYLDRAEAEGAVRHEVHAGALPERGSWCRPCFFSDVEPNHVIAREEVFGPVLAVMSFRTPDEAVERANDTPYGLAAGVWTDKGSKVLEIARRLRAGVVWCNTYNRFDPAAPFGGYKQSGFGREGGRHGLRAYVEL